MDETLRHMEAFEYYYSLGLDRSYEKVAEYFSVAVNSVGRWGKEFKWKQRVLSRDLEMGKKLREKNSTTIEDEKEQYRGIIRASLSSYIKELKAGNIKVTKVSDVIALIELDLKLQGLGQSKDDVSNETANTIGQLINSIRANIDAGADAGE